MATRFQVEPLNWGRTIKAIRLPESVIPVRTAPLRNQLQGNERMVFTWLDGTDYIISGPNPPHGAVHIISSRGKLWWGLPLVNSVHRQQQASPTVFMWHSDSQSITCNADRVCARSVLDLPLIMSLRDANGRRLATWFYHRRRLGVLRDEMPADMKPIILAMVLSSMYDF